MMEDMDPLDDVADYLMLAPLVVTVAMALVAALLAFRHARAAQPAGQRVRRRLLR